MNINPEQLTPGDEYTLKGKEMKYSPFGTNEPKLLQYSNRGIFLSRELDPKTRETILFFDRFILRFNDNATSNPTYRMGHFITIENIEAVENEQSVVGKIREKVVYRNGQLTENIADFVEQQLRDSVYAEITMKSFIRRPSKSFEQSYEGLLRRLAYLRGEHRYPAFNRKRQSLETQLYFSPAKTDDGIVLEGLIKKICELRSSKDRNKRTTIVLRIQTKSYKK